MLFEKGVTRHGRSSFESSNLDANQEHNREILREIVKEYLYRKGKLRLTYKENYVPVYNKAPYGQVLFAAPDLFERTVNRLERQVGHFYMSRIEVMCGAEMSETERRARKIVSTWE